MSFEMMSLVLRKIEKMIKIARKFRGFKFITLKCYLFITLSWQIVKMIMQFWNRTTNLNFTLFYRLPILPPN